MKVLVFGGAGRIGSPAAWDLVKADDVEEVGIVDRRPESLEMTRSWIGSEKVSVHALDIFDRQALMDLMKRYDVGLNALPDRRASYEVVDAAIRGGLSIVDVLEEYHRNPDRSETEGLEIPSGMSPEEYGECLHNKAIENGVTLLDGMGFAPGLSNVTVGEGIRKLDKAETAVARVGGIPSKEAAKRHPLRYMITWAFGHVLREYTVKVNVMRNGKVVEVFATSDRETFRFVEFGKDEELECAITPGMPSFLYTRPNLREFSEKTIRWPGHWNGIDVLKECGLLDLEPADFRGAQIPPRDFLFTLLEPRLRPAVGDTDVCVMWNTVTGRKDGRRARVDYYMWEEADVKNGISSMARTTAFPAAIGALFVGRREIRATGIVPPEDAFEGGLYGKLALELEKRGVIVRETCSLPDESG
jgi:saccharopine dehydrogenase-like NADP-dependent oxidoreductase